MQKTHFVDLRVGCPEEELDQLGCVLGGVIRNRRRFVAGSYKQQNSLQCVLRKLGNKLLTHITVRTYIHAYI